jgi:hypothetical protein
MAASCRLAFAGMLARGVQRDDVGRVNGLLFNGDRIATLAQEISTSGFP